MRVARPWLLLLAAAAVVLFLLGKCGLGIEVLQQPPPADHTLYRLDFPVGDDESLEAALGFLRRVAGDMDLNGETVDAKSCVILREIEEMQASTMFFRKSATLLPGVCATRHRPSGNIETVEAATPAALCGFWERHYVPCRTGFATNSAIPKGCSNRSGHRSGSQRMNRSKLPI